MKVSLILSKHKSYGSEIDIGTLGKYADYLNSQAHQMKVDYAAAIDLETLKLRQNHAKDLEVAKKQMLKDSEVFSQELYENAKEQFVRFLEFLQLRLSDVLIKASSKLGLLNVSAAQVAELLKGELSGFVGVENVTVRANADTINYLKICIENSNLVKEYEVDESMADGYCMVSDGKFVVFVNVAVAVNKIKELLANPLGSKNDIINQDQTVDKIGDVK